MAWGDGKLRGTKDSSASKLPVAPGRSSKTLNLTVLEDESQIIGSPRGALPSGNAASILAMSESSRSTS